jgi:uncharacterized repeat protein (TIGR03803 family)
MTATTGIVRVLYTLATADGDRPEGLVVTGDYVYGTTRRGGPHGRGVVFRLRDTEIGPGIDREPPVLTVPGDSVIEATGAAGARVDYVAAAVDLVDGSLPVTCTPASGSTFPIGTTLVNCSSSDWRGHTASQSFIVSVGDTTPPVITAPSDMIIEATSAAGRIVTFAATAIDQLDGTLPVVCAPASGSMFPIGRTLVNCSSSDGRGNTASKSFFVTVVDTTPPVLTVPANIVVEATSTNGEYVSYGATAFDNVDGNVLVTCTPSSGSLFAVGATQVTCYAADRRNNGASASFTVTVRECSLLQMEISEAREEILSLQAELKHAAPGEKAALIRAIRALQTHIQKLTARARQLGCSV